MSNCKFKKGDIVVDLHPEFVGEIGRVEKVHSSGRGYWVLWLMGIDKNNSVWQYTRHLRKATDEEREMIMIETL